MKDKRSDLTAETDKISDVSTQKDISAHKKPKKIKAEKLPKEEKPPKIKKEKSVKIKKPKKESISVARFNADPDVGLSAAQVSERIAAGLTNKTPKKYSKTYANIFIGNICTFFNLLCLLAALALLAAHAPLSQFTFVLIFLCNIFWGIFQEIRAKRKIDKLSILSSPTARVIRDKKQLEIPAENIVIDDVILLVAGQQVPTDCVMLDGMAELNESLLTGESVPIKKEYGQTLFAGSFVASGKLAGRVDKIGGETYISKLTARAKKYKKPNSEIINSIHLFIKIIGILIIPVAILMFLTNLKFGFSGGWSDLQSAGGFWKVLSENNPKLNTAIQKTCSVVIGMIPSGLLLLTTVALSFGMIRLAKYNTLVQDMYSLEMLARVNVLCLDKTGTITDGRMKVSDCMILGNSSEFSIEDIMGSILASLDDNNQTSIALYERFGHASALQPTAQIPFSSARKLSAVSFGENGTYVMGAPEFVLKPMPARVEKIVKQYAQMGLRVMVVAHSPAQIVGDKLPTVFRPVAVITLSDNIRSDAVQTIKWFRDNEVEVKVISGDNPVTVSEVARRAGVKNASQYLSLEGLSDLEVEAAANEYTVFGRVTPEQKAILIRTIKKSGNTVAMTGDGVNDILAMKEADCAISVASGSEAARNVSNLVLQDNNFGSMPRIVGEGRRVINNIKDSASLYIMKTIFTIILAVVCIATSHEYFFTTNNMLIYEILISALPSLVLSLQPNTERVHGKFIPFVISRALPGAITMAFGIIAIYAINTYAPSVFLSKTGDGSSVYGAMLMLSLTFTGLVMLLKICQPLNTVRAIMYCIVVGLCVMVVSVPVFGEIVYEGWTQVRFDATQILLLIVIVQAAIPVSGGLIKLFDGFNPAEE